MNLEVSLGGCHDCFEASLRAGHFGAADRRRAAQVAPTAHLQPESVRRGAWRGSNKSLQRTATGIKCQALMPLRAAAELDR